MKVAFTLIAALMLYVTPQTVPGPAPVQLPNGVGVFAVTDQGAVELTAYGEEGGGKGAGPSFNFSQEALGRIPILSSVRSFYVNMPDWRPKTLFLLAGRDRLAAPQDDYRQLTYKIYPKGVVAIELISHELTPAELQREYRKMAERRRPGEDIGAFMVLQLSSQSGLRPRLYPVQIGVQADPARK